MYIYIYACVLYDLRFGPGCPNVDAQVMRQIVQLRQGGFFGTVVVPWKSIWDDWDSY